MPCTGSGQRRFKFVHRGADDRYVPCEILDGRKSRVRDTAQLLRWRQHEVSLTVARMPASQTALIASNLHSRLQVTDIRFDTSCFGDFIDLMPQRVGTNKALDAAADDFATAFNNLHVWQGRLPSKQVMIKHGNALRTLRDALGQPVEDLTIETMCAAYLIMVTESLIREESERHAQGMSLLLASGIHRKWKTRFELEILTVMCFTILMECIGNPNMHIDPWIDDVLNRLEPPRTTGPVQYNDSLFRSLDMRAMAAVVKTFRAPWADYDELLSKYKGLMRDRQAIRAMVTAAMGDEEANRESRASPNKFLRVLLVQTSMVTSMCIAHSGLLQQFDLDNAELAAERETCIGEMLELGALAMAFRPLGAMHLLPGLNLVWAIAEDQGSRDRARHMVKAVHSCGFAVSDSMRSPNWWRKKLAHTRRQIVRQETEGAADKEDIELRDECHVQ